MQTFFYIYLDIMCVDQFILSMRLGEFSARPAYGKFGLLFSFKIYNN